MISRTLMHWAAGIALILGFLANTVGCSSQSCTEYVKTKEEAHQALAAFFTSDSPAARRLIAVLRRDGMTDEYLARLQEGCRGWCYVYREDGHHRDRTQEIGSWYAIAGIAPTMNQEARDVELKIECSTSVLLEERLYGG